MTSGAPEFQRTFPLRKPSTGDDSEYYGVPLPAGRAAPSLSQLQSTGGGVPGGRPGFTGGSPRTMPRNSSTNNGSVQHHHGSSGSGAAVVPLHQQQFKYSQEEGRNMARLGVFIDKLRPIYLI